MPPDELSTFLDAYALPALIYAEGEITYQNSHFRKLCLSNDALVSLCFAARDHAGVVETREPLDMDEIRSISWTLTTQYFPNTNRVWRTVVLAQPSPDHHFMTPETTNGALTETHWLNGHRFAGIRTGGGPMGDLIRNLDWSKTLLGPIQSWSITLITMVGVLMSCPMAMALYWGPEHVLIYNNGFTAIMGSHHPDGLGKPAREAWAEEYDTLEHWLKAAMSGQGLYYENTCLNLERRTDHPTNIAEETYFTWAYAPVRETSGKVVGILHPTIEVTEKYIGARRMHAMRELGVKLSMVRSYPAMWAAIAAVLDGDRADLPYAAIYSTQRDKYPLSTPPPEPTFTLLHAIGLEAGSMAAPFAMSAEFPGAPQSLSKMGQTRDIVVFSVREDLLDGVIPRNSKGRNPTEAAVLPILHADSIMGCIVVFLSPYQPVNSIISYLTILVSQINSYASIISTFEGEVRKNEELAALDQAKTTFFTNMSHELRTPLTLILGPTTELLRDVMLSSRHANHLGIIRRNAERLLRLVNDIMNFSHAESGMMKATFQPTSIGPYTVDLASNFRAAAEQHGLQFSVESEVPIDLVVFLDREKYIQIFYNLLGNAIKYTRQGSITVRTTMEDGMFKLWVKDTGVGIPRSDMPLIFKKFHRAANIDRNSEGAGVGLALSQELVKLHKGGAIHVESEPGRGSLFCVMLPLGFDHLPPTDIMDGDPLDWKTHTLPDEFVQQRGSRDSLLEEPTWEKEDDTIFPRSKVMWKPFSEKRPRARVLVVDDNLDMQTYITHLLSPYCDVETAVNGRRGWEALQRAEYDLVISDWMMPDMNGPELLDAIRNNNRMKDMPFIMLTARSGDESRLSGLLAGADEYISKPFSAKEFLLRVRMQIQSCSLRKRLEQDMEGRTKALEESQESFRRLSERLQVGVHRSDVKGNITWGNEKWMKTLNLQNHLDEWAHKIHYDDRNHAVDAYRQAVETGEGYKEPIEMRLVDGDVEMDIIYDLQPEHTASGEFLGWVGVFSDVSVLRRLERANVEAERMRAEDAERNRMQMEGFIDITCHELRNPLNAIYNSAELLGESLVRVKYSIDSLRNEMLSGLPQDKDHREWSQIATELQEDMDGVKTIILCAQHQKRIADVLNVSKLTAGLISLVKAEFHAHSEVYNVIRMFRDEVSARGLQLQLEKDESWDRMAVDFVSGDSGRFTQVIVNLLSNAVKFTETAARHELRVRIGALPALAKDAPIDWPTGMDIEDLLPMCRDAPIDKRSRKIRLYVAVADSGHGMSTEEQEHLFQRFSQASPKTYGEFGGHGLGLYISRMMVQLQGGDIYLTSVKGKGTVLRFFITVDRSQRRSSVSLPQAPNLFDRNPACSTVTKNVTRALSGKVVWPRIRVLVVEDNLINQKLLVRLLSDLGCDTTPCPDGQFCLDLLEQQATTSEESFDLILMDLEMPVLDGLSATKRIREMEGNGTLRGRVPIIAVSGNARSEWTERATCVGMDGFIRKPYSKKELNEVIARFFSANWHAHGQ